MIFQVVDCVKSRFFWHDNVVFFGLVFMWFDSIKEANRATKIKKGKPDCDAKNYFKNDAENASVNFGSFFDDEKQKDDVQNNENENDGQEIFKWENGKLDQHDGKNDGKNCINAEESITKNGKNEWSAFFFSPEHKDHACKLC